MSAKIIFEGFKIDDYLFGKLTGTNNKMSDNGSVDLLLSKLDEAITCGEGVFHNNFFSVVVDIVGGLYLTTEWKRIKETIVFDINSYSEEKKKNYEKTEQNFVINSKLELFLTKRIQHVIVFQTKKIYDLNGNGKIVGHPFD